MKDSNPAVQYRRLSYVLKVLNEFKKEAKLKAKQSTSQDIAKLSFCHVQIVPKQFSGLNASFNNEYIHELCDDLELS